MNASAEKAGEKLFKTFYSDGLGYVGSPAAARPLLLYERYSLIQGPFLVLLLVAAQLGGLLFLPSPLRATAALFTLTALFSITFAIAGNNYDARYAYPTFGLLAAGSALGLWGMGRHLSWRYSAHAACVERSAGERRILRLCPIFSPRGSECDGGARNRDGSRAPPSTHKR